MSKFIFEEVNSCVNCNNNNVKNYTPYYIVGDAMYIDKSWYYDLLDLTKERFQSVVSYYKLNPIFTNINVPHDNLNVKYENMYIDFYKVYLRQYDYENWYNSDINDNQNMDVKIIKISHNDVKILDEFAEKYFKKITNKDLEKISKKFIQEIDDVIQYFKKKNIIKFFVKLSGTSGKKDHELVPLFDTHDIIKFISHYTFKSEYKKIYNKTYDINVHLIIMPWNDMFDNKKYEFRAFMYNNKLTCISQQVWFDSHQYSKNELEHFKHIFLNFENKSILKNATIDLYIQNDKIHVIEYNPFGPYSASGSSLFNWITDYDKIHNTNDNIFFRYLK